MIEKFKDAVSVRVKRFVRRLHYSKWHRFYFIKAKNVANMKPFIVGISYDPYLVHAVEIRIMLIWWHFGVWLGDNA